MSTLFDLDNACEADPAITRWWSTKPPALSAIAREWFDVIKHSGNDVLEVLHDDFPTACVGRYAFAHVGAFTSHVNVAFFYGAHLPDPHGIIEGTGRNMRHVKIRPGKPVPREALYKLIQSAYRDIHQRIDQLPITSGNRKLTDLANIGKKIAGRLNEAGIFSEDELRIAGPVEAHRRIKALYPDETLGVCYYLYSFEGALTDMHWDKIPEQRKQELRQAINRN